MNMVKLNNKLTAQVIDIVNTFNAYEGITEEGNFWTYHRENGAEVLDIDFRLKITDSGLMVVINKSYDKDTISGGHYTEDIQAELEPTTLDIWLEDNGIFTKQAHFLADKMHEMVKFMCLWSEGERDFYNIVYDMYNKNSCEMSTAIQILLEKLPNLIDRYYVQKVWLEVQINEEKINNLF